MVAGAGKPGMGAFDEGLSGDDNSAVDGGRLRNFSRADTTSRHSLHVAVSVLPPFPRNSDNGLFLRHLTQFLKLSPLGTPGLSFGRPGFLTGSPPPGGSPPGGAAAVNIAISGGKQVRQ